MNFAPFMVGAMSGDQQYQDAIQARQAKAQQMQFEKMRAQALQAEMERQRQEQARQADIARGTIALYGQPQGGQQPQPPMPGQSSQPMQQGGPRPQPWQPMNTDRPPQGQAPQGPAPIPPYRSMSGGPQAPQQAPQIPEPPKYDWATAVERVKAQGITDPQAIVATLEKHQARLDVEARQRLAAAKEQLAEQRATAHEQYEREMLKVRQKAEDRQERNTDSMISKRGRTGGGAGGTGAGGGAGGPDPGVDAAAWDRIISGHAPPARGGMYTTVMRRVAAIAKENGMSTEELLTSSADVKTKLAAKKQFETRAQNTARAENVLNREIPNFEQAVEKVNTSSVPGIAKLQLAARRQMGDPEVTRMDQAADVIFREFEGIVTGNPGTLNVQDVQNAHEAYKAAQTPQQAKAAIAGMRRIIDNAKKGLDDTRKEIMGDINKQLHGSKGESDALPSGWSVKVK